MQGSSEAAASSLNRRFDMATYDEPCKLLCSFLVSMTWSDFLYIVHLIVCDGSSLLKHRMW